MINHCCEKDSNLPQSNLRQLNSRPEEETILFVLEFNPKNPNIIEKINNAFNTLTTDDNMSQILSKTKEPPSLDDMLTNSCLTNSRPTPGVNKCGGAQCKVCNDIIPTDVYFQFPFQSSVKGSRPGF